MSVRFSSLSFLSSIFGLLLFSLLVGCSNESKTEQTTTAIIADEAVSSESVAANFFSTTELQAIVKIKNRFEQGLRQSFEKRTVGYAYTQNALRMRLNFLEKDDSDMPFPFNGTFSFAELSEELDKLPFVTEQCGFLIDATKEQVNYYCLAMDENYFNYLNAIPDENGLIGDFVKMYKEKKSINPQYRQGFLMNAMENLDLNNWDHQFFYMLMQCWRNEELMAYFKTKTQQPALKTEKQ